MSLILVATVGGVLLERCVVARRSGVWGYAGAERWTRSASVRGPRPPCSTRHCARRRASAAGGGGVAGGGGGGGRRGGGRGPGGGGGGGPRPPCPPRHCARRRASAAGPRPEAHAERARREEEGVLSPSPARDGPPAGAAFT